jgi:hypothetical protein
LAALLFAINCGATRLGNWVNAAIAAVEEIYLKYLGVASFCENKEFEVQFFAVKTLSLAVKFSV